MSSQVKQQPKNIDLKEFLIKYKSLVGLLVLITIVTILSPSFLSTKNIFNILRQTSVNGIIATGMTFVILTGGIDLSVGSCHKWCSLCFTFSIWPKHNNSSFSCLNNRCYGWIFKWIYNN